MKYDIVIVSHEKDFHKIKYVLGNAIENLSDFEEIHLILSERAEFQEKEDIEKIAKETQVFYHKETEVLIVDKNKIKHRPNWIYQMMIKFFQNVTKNDNYLVIESDMAILSKLNFFENDKTVFYLGLDGNHEPYFNFNEKLMGLKREYDHSFISEMMMYDKKKIKELIKKCDCEKVDDFLNLVYDLVDKDCYPADYELYGNFCYKYFKDEFLFKNLIFNYSGKHGNWTDQEIIDRIESHRQCDTVSFHMYV
jgi:hypothetical protein